MKNFIYKIVYLFFTTFFLLSCEPEVVKPVSKKSKISTTSVYDKFNKNTYNAVKIGNSYWFQTNLNSEVYTTIKIVDNIRYIDSIHSLKPYSLDISSFLRTPDDTLNIQWPYNGKKELAEKYGRMYTWYAASDKRNVCPVGWHVPTEKEWDDMITFLGTDSLAGGKLKDTSNLVWNSPNLAEDNPYKFKLKATGYRSEFGSFLDQGKFAFLWSSTSDPEDIDYAICYVLYAHSKKIFKRKISKRTAMAVRCVR